MVIVLQHDGIYNQQDWVCSDIYITNNYVICLKMFTTIPHRKQWLL